MGFGEIVLVTGASGFVATGIIKCLLEEGHTVKGSVRDLNNKDKYSHLHQLPNAHNLQLVQADLLIPDSWSNAVNGCKYVIHVASPFPKTVPNDPEEIIKPAVEGTLNVLKACQQSKSVKRVVITSSIAAVYDSSIPVPKSVEESKIFNEDNWTNVEDSNLDTYAKSKALSEKAAWDFVQQLPENEKFELVAINPGLVLGPLIGKMVPTSLEIIKKLLDRSIAGVAKVKFSVTDIRDVALAHVRALTYPEAAGKRFLISTSSVWMKEIALVLQKHFKPMGYNIPTLVAPNFAVWLVAFFDRTNKLVVSRLSRDSHYDNSRMKTILKIEPTDFTKSVIDAAQSLIDLGLVKKPKKIKNAAMTNGSSDKTVEVATSAQ